MHVKGDKEDLFDAEQRWRTRRLFSRARPRRNRLLLLVVLFSGTLVLWLGSGELQPLIQEWVQKKFLY